MDHRAVITTQKQDDLRNILGLAEPPQRHLARAATTTAHPGTAAAAAAIPVGTAVGIPVDPAAALPEQSAAELHRVGAAARPPTHGGLAARSPARDVSAGAVAARARVGDRPRSDGSAALERGEPRDEHA